MYVCLRGQVCVYHGWGKNAHLGILLRVDTGSKIILFVPSDGGGDTGLEAGRGWRRPGERQGGWSGRADGGSRGLLAEGDYKWKWKRSHEDAERPSESSGGRARVREAGFWVEEIHLRELEGRGEQTEMEVEAGGGLERSGEGGGGRRGASEAGEALEMLEEVWGGRTKLGKPVARERGRA